MSYTAPEYVDTKAQAILALASVIADEDKTALGDGSVNRALDVLADVLAESDVQVPQTNAGAILALAQYAKGGGGGGGATENTIFIVGSVGGDPITATDITITDIAGNNLTLTPKTMTIDFDGVPTVVDGFEVTATIGEILEIEPAENLGFNVARYCYNIPSNDAYPTEDQYGSLGKGVGIVVGCYEGSYFSADMVRYG